MIFNSNANTDTIDINIILHSHNPSRRAIHWMKSHTALNTQLKKVKNIQDNKSIHAKCVAQVLDFYGNLRKDI